MTKQLINIITLRANASLFEGQSSEEFLYEVKETYGPAEYESLQEYNDGEPVTYEMIEKIVNA